MFTLKIETENAAFEGYRRRPEVANMLRRVAEYISDGDDSGSLTDSNGNKVGSFEFTD